MANKKRKKYNNKQEEQVRQVSKAEKNMFSLGARARDKMGNLIWKS